MDLGATARFAAVALMWGSTYFWITLALEGMSATQFSVLRVLVGAGTLLAVVGIVAASMPRRASVWLTLLGIGFLLNALPVLLVQVVPDATGEDVGVVSVFNASVAVWVLALVPLLRPAGERRPGPVLVLGILVGFAGVLLMFPPWEDSGRWLTWGSLINFLAAVGYGLGTILMSRLMAAERMRPLVLSTCQALFGVLWAASTIPVQGWGAAPQWSVPVVVALVVLGAGNTAIVFTFFVRMVRDEGPLRANTVLFLVPVVLTLGSVWLEGARVDVLGAVGIALAVVGVVIARLPRRGPARGPRTPRCRLPLRPPRRPPGPDPSSPSQEVPPCPQPRSRAPRRLRPPRPAPRAAASPSSCWWRRRRWC